MLHATRDVALKLIRSVGGFHLIGSSPWRRRRLLILCYHGFSLRDEHLWDPGLFVTAEHLALRLERLRALRCTLLPLAEALELLRTGSLPPRAVALTVDDGNYDFLAKGLPVLERFGAHATVYVSTYHVADQRPVFDVMAGYLLWRASQNGRIELNGWEGGERLPVGDNRQATASAAALRRRSRLEAWSAADKHRCLEDLAGAAGEDWASLLEARLLSLMRPAELSSLPPANAEIQLHTHRHRVPRDRNLFLRELADNRRSLAAAGLEPSSLKHFCYPSGEHHPEFLPWLAEDGVRSAVTCVPGLAAQRTEPLLLPRFVDTYGTTGIEFDAWCVGLRESLRRKPRAAAEA